MSCRLSFSSPCFLSYNAKVLIGVHSLRWRKFAGTIHKLMTGQNSYLCKIIFLKNRIIRSFILIMNFQMIEIALYDNIVDLNSKRTFCP